MIKAIKWYSQKEMSNLLGVCVNTFKKQYRDRYPPNKTVGNKLYWSDDYAVVIIKDVLGDYALSDNLL